MQEDVLQDDLWSHGTEANTASSLDEIRDAVSAEEGFAMAIHTERRDCSLCQVMVLPGWGQPSSAWTLLWFKDIIWAAAAGCYSYPDT